MTGLEQASIFGIGNPTTFEITRNASYHELDGFHHDKPRRTVDDFLVDLHHRYRQRHHRHGHDQCYNRCDGISDTPSKGTVFVTLKDTPSLGFVGRRIVQSVRHACNGCCDSVRNLLHLPLPLLALCIANSSDSTEILMLSYLLANPTFSQEMLETSDPSSSTQAAEYLASSIFLGMLLGGTILGFLSDTIGRRPTLLIGLFTNATAGTLSSIPFLTPSFVELTLLRFIAGIGIGATVPPLFSLASEWSPKDIRGGVVTMVASFWMMGSIFVSGVAWCLFHNSEETTALFGKLSKWRVFAAVCALPSALGFIMVYVYVPESPRFFSARHDFREAVVSCHEMATTLGICLESPILESNRHSCEMKEDGPLESSACHNLQILTVQDLEHSSSSNTRTNGGRNSTRFKSLRSVRDTLGKLYSPQLLSQTTLPLQTLWFSLSFGTYGIATWINSLFVAVQLKNLYFNSFLFAFANLPGNIISIMYSDKWGRKRLLVGSLLGAAVSLAGFSMLVYFSGTAEDINTSPPRTWVIVLAASSFQMFSIVSWNAIDVISGEVFPTRVRSAGMGICTASGRMGAIVAQVANAKLMMSSEGNDGTVASAWVLVLASLALLLGAVMTMFFGRDPSGDELRDDVGEGNTGSRTIGGDGWRTTQKEHLSDEENDGQSSNTNPMNFELRDTRGLNQYNSLHHEVEANESFLI